MSRGIEFPVCGVDVSNMFVLGEQKRNSPEESTGFFELKLKLPASCTFPFRSCRG